MAEVIRLSQKKNKKKSEQSESVHVEPTDTVPIDEDERVARERFGHQSKELDGLPKKCIRIKANNERCKLWAVQGGSVCHRHGGLAPKIKANGNKRREQAKVERVVMKMRERGLLRSEGEDQHPLVHLLNELYLSAGVVKVLGDMVGDLEDVSQYGGEGKGREAHILYQMWAEERDRHANFAMMALKAGVAERQVRIAEQQAELVASAIRNILRELGVEQDPRAPQIVRKHLMALSPPSPNSPTPSEEDLEILKEA